MKLGKFTIELVVEMKEETFKRFQDIGLSFSPKSGRYDFIDLKRDELAELDLVAYGTLTAEEITEVPEYLYQIEDEQR